MASLKLTNMSFSIHCKLFILKNIEITHVFSCISICRVPRKLFEHEAVMPSVQTSSEGPGKCKCNETNMCDRFLAYFTWFQHKTRWKRRLNIKYPFSYTWFLKSNGVSVNFRTSVRRHNVIYTRATLSRTKASAKWSVTAATLSSVTSCMQIRAQLRLFK